MLPSSVTSEVKTGPAENGKHRIDLCIIQEILVYWNEWKSGPKLKLLT